MALFPTVPEDVVVEMWLAGNWTDLVASGKIRLQDGIRINRGKSSASIGFSSPPPSSCSFTIDNRSGNYSPDNPLALYYGDLERGTSVRVAERVAKDSFTRSTSNSLGTADVGGVWSLAGAASHFATTGTAATITFSAANDSALAFQAAQFYRDHDVAATFTFPFSNVTGASVEVDLLVGGLSSSDFFQARLAISTAEVMSFDIVHLTSGTTIAFPITVTDFAFTGQAIRMRVQMSGQTLRAKVWPAASAEPETWHLEESYAFDQFLDRAPSWAGFRAGVSSGNTNVPFAVTVDNWEVRINRFTGTVANLTVGQDTSGRDVYTMVEAGTIRRRLTQGAKPLRSSYRRFMSDGLTPANLLYYPVEEGSGATGIASGLTGGAPMTISGNGPTQFATDSSFPGSLPIGKPSGARWTSQRIAATATGEAQLIFLLSVPSGGETDQATMAQMQLSGTAGFVDIVYGATSGGNLYLVFYGQDRIAVHTSATLLTGLNGNPCQITVELTQNGANIDYLASQLFVGDLSAANGSGTCAGRTISKALGFMVDPYTQATAISVGHVALRNDIVVSLDFMSPLNAWSNSFVPLSDWSLSRIERLCSENGGINNTFIRRPNLLDDGTFLGPQGVKTLLELLDESVKADLGTLYESRDVPGFVYRYGRSKWNQDAVLSLDISAGQLAPPFSPVYDDQQLTNDVTVTRDGGSSTQVTKDTGTLSIADAGRYDTADTYCLNSDDQTVDPANWLLHVGTAPGGRYPTMRVQLEKLATSSRQLYLDALAVDIEDRIVASNPNALIARYDIDQIAVGYTETLGGMTHEIVFACMNAAPYSVGEAADTVGDTNPWMLRADTDGSTVNTLANAGATSLSAATPSGPLWTTDSDDFPLYLDVGGIKVRATACSGASSPQTFTVDALPVARAAGLSILAWNPGFLGW